MERSGRGAPHGAVGRIPAVRARCQPCRSLRDETPLTLQWERTRARTTCLLIVKASRELAWLPPGPLTGHARARKRPSFLLLLLPRSAAQPVIMAPWIANATSDTAQTHIARLSLSRAQPPAAPLRSRIMSSQHIASGWMRANARHVPCQGRGSDAALHAAMLLCVRAAQGATR